MEWVDCIKHTGYGDIAVNWSKNESEISLKLEIPVNTSATVLLPSGELQIEGAKPEAGKDGVIQVYPTEEENKLKLGSGNYEFVLAN
ncbi:MAG: alpha-L-rhamnosidase C-terminal domain-containing protein, partial [Bacteroidales bacterium]